MASVPMPLNLTNNKRTAVIYVYHKMDRNVQFFMRHGLSDPNAVYFIVENKPEWPDDHEVKKVRREKNQWFIQRPNVCNDFGGYSQALQLINLDDYDYFAFINSTMRGPFLPQFVQRPNGHVSWTQCFSNLLNDTVALVGSSINNYKHQHPHVQSMAMVCDRRAIDIWQKHQVMMTGDIPHKPKNEMIHNHEIRGSTVLLQAGYNIDCLITAYRHIDWRQPQKNLRGCDLWSHKGVFGYTIHPLETVFVKVNRDYGPSTNQIEFFTRWYEAWNPKTDTLIGNPLDMKSWEKDAKEEEKTAEQKRTHLWRTLCISISSVAFVIILILLRLVYNQ
jgi:hypothetical protein